MSGLVQGDPIRIRRYQVSWRDLVQVSADVYADLFTVGPGQEHFLVLGAVIRDTFDDSGLATELIRLKVGSTVVAIGGALDTLTPGALVQTPASCKAVQGDIIKIGATTATLGADGTKGDMVVWVASV